ncbi:hypothetical protein LRS56_18555 [Pseudomonas poae]|nr:hypothetical protein LRS56_18555 [Pseudomonas poae]
MHWGTAATNETLVEKLQGITRTLPAQRVPDASLTMSNARAQMETALASHLKSTMMYVCEDSSFPALQPLPANRLISLEAFILASGMPVPKTLKALSDLTEELALQARAHPLGNLSGGQPSTQDQDSILDVMHSNTSGLPGLPLVDSAKGALGYLLSGSSVLEADLKTPVKAMEKLLGSPKAQALGQAIQTRLGIAATEGAGHDSVMTAIHLGLDPQPLTTATRTHVAGFDLAQSQHWGQPASVVIEELARHLIETGRASEQTANLAAYLLLAKTAPQYLVKDIPARVTYASVLWAQLAMAVARIEAHTPGATLGMGYAEILLAGEQLNADPDFSQQMAYQVLKEWGIANGFIASAEQAPSASDMERVRAAYNGHLSTLKSTSTLLQTPIPSRESMALAQLEAAFPELDASLFKLRNLQKARLKEGRPGLYPGMRSMLDIVMEGGKLGAKTIGSPTISAFPSADSATCTPPVNWGWLRRSKPRTTTPSKPTKRAARCGP